MNRSQRVIRLFVHCFSATAAWFVFAVPALAQSPAPSGSGGGEGGSMDYMLSYLVVALALVLGVLVVGRASNRKDREGPGGYVEKNIMSDE